VPKYVSRNPETSDVGSLFRLQDSGIKIRQMPLESGMAGLFFSDQSGMDIRDTTGWQLITPDGTVAAIESGWAKIPSTCLENGFVVHFADGTVAIPELIPSTPNDA
jgi:hypothetical protein